MKWYQKLYIRFIKCFIVPCEQASFLLTKKDFQKLSFKEAWRLRAHMIKCKYCRWLQKENTLLSETILHTKHKIDHENLPFSIDPSKLEEIKAKIRTQQ